VLIGYSFFFKGRVTPYKYRGSPHVSLFFKQIAHRSSVKMSGTLNSNPDSNVEEVQFLAEIIIIEDDLIEEELMLGEEVPDVTFLEEIITLNDDGK
jgi:hypothetical protein